MRVAEIEANAKRDIISVFNTVERLNKRPSVFINYLRVLALAKSMTFTIQYPSHTRTRRRSSGRGSGSAGEEEDEGGVQGQQRRGRQGPLPRGIPRYFQAHEYGEDHDQQ